MEATHCLNCNEPLQGNYCHQCGQKAATHRLSMKHFFLHDMVHGFWHLERGILYSLKGILLRPGKTVKEYIAGKRAGHFNIITLLLLLSGLLFFISDKQDLNGNHGSFSLGEYDITEWVHHYAKYILLSVTPFLAIIGQLVFRRAHYNFTEHLLIYCYYLTAVIVVYIIAGALNWATGLRYDEMFDYIKLASMLVCYFFVLWQCHGANYSVVGWLWRVLTSIVLLAVVLLVLILVIVGTAHWLTGTKSLIVS